MGHYETREDAVAAAAERLGDMITAARDANNPRNKIAVPLNSPAPLYMVPSDDASESDPQGKGPDDNDDGMAVINREREDFERFVNELDRYTDVTEHPETTAEVVFDYFDKLNPEPPRLTPAYRRAMGEILPLVFKEDHRVEIIVWAGTPHPNAWARAAREATQIESELIQMGNLQQEQLARINFTGKPWIDSVAKRPVCSVVINRIGATNSSTRTD
jgi:hypothetical protein